MFTVNSSEQMENVCETIESSMSKAGWITSVQLFCPLAGKSDHLLLAVWAAGILQENPSRTFSVSDGGKHKM